MPDETKTASAWRRLFESHDVVRRVEQSGFVDLTANQLREVREPRLLTKIDHRVHLPPVFAEHDLGILTLSGNSWRIGKFHTFQEVGEWTPPGPKTRRVSIPDWIESLAENLITGEGAAMNAASACKVLEHFCGEPLVATVSGKGRSGDFDFVIGPALAQHKISVRGAQIEVDAGFEGESALWLVEAKRHICGDFNVRQLYYPMRAWSTRVRKPVRTIFLTFANNVFDLHEFQFPNLDDFSSIQPLRHERYLLASGTVDVSSLRRFAAAIEAGNGHAMNEQARARRIPSPQADDFERLIDLTEFLSEEPASKEDIAVRYPIVPRQIDYYLNAARYLGLVEEANTHRGEDVRYQATPIFRKLLSKPNHVRQMRLAEIVLGYGPIAHLYGRWTESGDFPARSEVIEAFRRSPASSALSEVTLIRRASTVRMWLKWVCELGSVAISVPDLEQEPE